MRVSSNAKGMPYSLVVAMAISNNQVRKSSVHPLVVALPRDCSLHLQEGKLQWMTSASVVQQRYCLYIFQNTSKAILKRKELTNDVRKIGKRLYCSAGITNSKQMQWSLHQHSFKGRNVFAVYVVTHNKKIIQRRMDLLQVDL